MTSAESGRHAVVHVVREFLPLTENWIYELIRHAPDVESVIVCDRIRPDNTLPTTRVYPLPSRWAQLTNQVWRKLTNGNCPHGYRHILKRYHPALMHAHFGDQGVLMLPTARHWKIPLITSFYGYDVSKLPRDPMWRQRLAHLFQTGDLFLAEGPHLRERLCALGCPPSRVLIQPLGIDPQTIHFRPRKRHAGPVRLLMAASMREKKGLTYGLRAILHVLNQFPESLYLTVIGDGPLRSSLEAMVKQSGATDRVRFLGYQPRAVFLDEALKADLFISPSVTASDGDTEGGAPVSLIEAQATGLPIISTTHADIPFVTRPDQSAILVAERDVHALVQALDTLLHAPERWAKMGCAGRNHVETHFHSRHLGLQLQARYRALIETNADHLRNQNRPSITKMPIIQKRTDW
jgi:colanic acid/amylovoran biosynthesis glycosyltransferase